MPSPSASIVTVGHGRATEADFAESLRAADVKHLVDVRTAPGSKHNPQFKREALEDWIPGAGFSYRWDKRLGGWRKLSDDSPDVALRHPSFRAYAGHMRTADFVEAIGDLLHPMPAAPASERTAVMCSETVWWRCHRRMIADYLTLIHGLEVFHLMPSGKLTQHPPLQEARTAGGDSPYLVYDQIVE